MTRNFRRFRSWFAAILLISFSLYHGFKMVASSARSYRNSSGIDPIAAFDRRFAPLKAQLLRQGCRKVGYVTDEPENGDWFIGYFQTQHALAPVVLDDSVDPAFVVANLRDQSSLTPIMRAKKLILVLDFGNGVALLARQTN